MNPELRRNLWLELSPHRMIGTPLVLVLVLALISADESRPWPSIFSAAVGILALLVHFWGTRKASEAVTEEVRNRTWDWQRLSSLTPWQMAWGKLAGSTAFSWYGAGLCLLAMAGAATMDRSIHGVGWIALGLVASGIALHGAALAGSIQASRKDSRIGARVGVFLLIPIAIVMAMAYGRGGEAAHGSASWYGWSIPALRFVSCSALALAGWGVLAVYREMCRELKVPTLPWAYPLFALFLGVYVAGFGEGRFGGITAVVFGTLAAALALTYYGLFAEVTTAMSLRRLVLRLRAQGVARALQELPLWASALALALAFAIAASLLPSPDGERGPGRWLGFFPIAVLLMAVRDAGLLVFFALGAKAKRVEALTLLYIVLLSWVLPSLLSAMGLQSASVALWPFSLPGGVAALVMAAHVVVISMGVRIRWRRMARALDV